MLFAALLAAAGLRGREIVQDRVDWPRFMSRHDMVWSRLPESWRDALWFGNGRVGSLLWREGDRLRLQVFRSDVTDHRSFREGYSGYSRPRLQIGSFLIEPHGKIIGGHGRLGLYDAEFDGTIETDRGQLRIRHLVHSLDPVIYTEITGEGGEADPRWVWQPAPALPTRPGYPTTPAALAAMRKTYRSDYFAGLYVPNPPMEEFELGGVFVSRELLLAGGEYSVAWAVFPSDSRGPQRCVISIANCPPSAPQFSDRRAAAAVGAVQRLSPAGLDRWIGRHRDWWHHFYSRSFVSLTDTRAETVYWTQMYKLGSAARGGAPIIDHGLWQTPSPWTFLTWDLNVQLSYWPTATSNHADIGAGLVDWLWDHRQGLIDNEADPAWRADSARAPLNTGYDLYQPKEADERILDNAEANLTWAMDDCWMVYRRTMDEGMLRSKIYPLLRRAVNNQLHHLYLSGGRWHMPPTESPEYGMARDANYELAALRWGCGTLIETCRRLGIEDPELPRWRDVLARLVDYPVDANGFRIGADVPFERAHRHASHLLMIYPYCLVNVDQPGARELIRRSVDHFYAVNHAAYQRTRSWSVFAGYTYTFLSLLHAVMGDGEGADQFLNGFIDYPLVARNGMYAEAGPVLETPLSAAQAVDEMLLQSWGDKIRIFPAVPKAWPEIEFSGLLAEGAFSVSAERRHGATQWVAIRSLAGEPCRIVPGFAGEPKVSGARPFRLTSVAAGCYDLDLKRGEEALLYDGRAPPTAIIAAVPANPSALNWYGLK